MTAHVPGPWTYEDGEILADRIGVPIANVLQPADFPCLTDEGRERAQAECDANGHVLAASTDMLEALRKVHTNMRVRAGEKGVKAWEGDFVRREVEAAIAKAEGRA